MTPVPMILGGFAFSAHGIGFTGIDRDVDSGWTSVPVVNDMDQLQWLGPRKEEIVIRGAIFPHEWGGLGTLAGIRAAGEAGRSQFLITMSGVVMGQYVVMGTGEDQSLHDALGTPRKDAYRIKLRRYTGAPSGAFGGGAVRLFS